MTTVGDRDFTAQGEALLEMKRPKDAADILRHAAATNPNDPRPRCLLALALLQSKLYEESLEAAQQAVVVAPDEEWAHRLSALAQLGLGRKKGAVEAIEHAAALAPDVPDVHIVRANVLNESGRAREAEEAARLAVELAPEDSNAHAVLGSVLLRAGRPSDAAEAFRRALQLDPEDAATHNDLGVAYTRMGKDVWATHEFERAAQLDPSLDVSRRNIVSSARKTSFAGLPLGLAIYATYRATVFAADHGSPYVGLVAALLVWWLVGAIVMYGKQRSEEHLLPARTQALLADQRARTRRRPWTWRPTRLYLPLPLQLVVLPFVLVRAGVKRIRTAVR